MNAATEIGLRAKVRWHARELQTGAAMREEAIRQARLIVVACARNEMPRIPSFLAHYRKLGIEHFLFVDNESTDGLQRYLVEQADCSSWIARGSYKASNFGMDWCNHLLGLYGNGKWCLTCDPDELLVYPHCEYRGLRSLTRYMEGIGQEALLAPLLDAYGPSRLSETNLTPDADPFQLCPYFDRLNLTQQFNEHNRNFWIQGGARLRCFFASDPQRAPALNKVPLVKWSAGLRYVSSMHHLNRPELNCTVRHNALAVSAVLFHFKYVNLLTQKAAEEMIRGEHYAGSTEYKAYLDAGDPVLFDPEVSVRFRDSRQLVELGFMQAGGWY